MRLRALLSGLKKTLERTVRSFYPTSRPLERPPQNKHSDNDSLAAHSNGITMNSSHLHATGPHGNSTKRFVMLLILTVAAASAACKRDGAGGNARALANVKQVLALAPEEAEQGRRVHLHAVVTYFLPTNSTLAVQDATAAIFVDTSQLTGEFTCGQE